MLRGVTAPLLRRDGAGDGFLCWWCPLVAAVGRCRGAEEGRGFPEEGDVAVRCDHV